MNPNDLKSQVSHGEDSRRQFKRDVTNVDSLAAELAAFSNSEGGVICSVRWKQLPMRYTLR